jgi:hypothetical protein
MTHEFTDMVTLSIKDRAMGIRAYRFTGVGLVDLEVTRIGRFTEPIHVFYLTDAEFKKACELADTVGQLIASYERQVALSKELLLSKLAEHKLYEDGSN